MYAFATKENAEFFDRHKDAFREYEKSKKKIKGVFSIHGRRVNEVNISANAFNGELADLKSKVWERLIEEESE